MSKNDVQPRTTKPKTMYDMSDVEFITYADYLSNPYYRAYIDAKKISEANAYAQQPARVYASEKRAAPAREQGRPTAGKGIVPKKGFRRRNGWIFLITLLMLVVVAGAVLSYLGILPEYTSLLIKTPAEGEATNMSVVDPVIGLVKKFVSGLEMTSVYGDEIVPRLETADTIGKIMYFGLPVAIVIYLITAVWMLIKGIVAMAGKAYPAKGYVRKKRRFGIGCIVMIVMALLVVVSGLFCAYGSFDGIADNAVNFLLNKTVGSFGASYLLLGFVAIPVISWILSAFCYKRIGAKR